MVPKYMWIILAGALTFFVVAAACVMVVTLFPGLCGSPLANTYTAYRQALQNEDVAALEELIAIEKRPELLGEGAEMKLKIIKEMMPEEFTVKSQEISGDEGTLKLEAVSEGQKMSGTVTFVREVGSWKVYKEHWSISMSGTSFGDGQALFPDPSKPPKPHVIMQKHQGAVTKLAFSPDGRFLVSLSYDDYTIRSWEPLTGSQISSVKSTKRPKDLAITPDGGTIIVADVYKNILLYQFSDGKIGAPRTLVTDAGDALTLGPDGTTIAATAFNHPIGVYSLKGGKLIKKIFGAKDQRVLCFDPATGNLVSGGRNTYSVWSGSNWKEERRTIAKVDGDMFGLDVSNDGKTLATAHGDSSIVIFDLRERKERRNFFVKDAATLATKIGPAGRLLATGNRKDVYLWDALTGKRKARLKGHENDVECLAFAPDGSTLASGGRDRKIILWRGGPAPAVAAAPKTKAKPVITPGKTLTLGKHKNFVKNHSANDGTSSWKTDGEAVIEPDAKGNPHFSIRYKGSFRQDADIRGYMDRYAVIIARVNSSRKNSGSDQTGYPYLYGYWVNVSNPNRFNGYLTGQHMLFRPHAANKWGVAYGIFQVPASTGSIRLFLQQADGRSAQDGSSARFDDVGIYILETEAKAQDLVDLYKTKAGKF